MAGAGEAGSESVQYQFRFSSVPVQESMSVCILMPNFSGGRGGSFSFSSVSVSVGNVMEYSLNHNMKLYKI